MTTDPGEQVAEPSDADACTAWGRVLQEQKRHEEALQAFERAVGLEPENAEAWRWKASALAHLARHAEVLASVEHALALDPENAWAWWRKGRTLSCLKRDKEALDALDQALRLNPASLLAWLDKGCTLYALGRYKEARDAFAEAQRLDPDNEYAASKVRAVQALLKREIPDKVLRLRDGRQLGYIDCGDPNGKPVFCFHGVPGSRLNWVTDDEPFRGHRLRLIAPDRPGMGLSDFKPDRAILDWPDDVAELADSLGIERFAVLGVSGGGAYAAASSYKLGERVTKLALVSSGAPYVRGLTRELLFHNRRARFVMRVIPWSLQRWISGEPVRPEDAAFFFKLRAWISKWGDPADFEQIKASPVLIESLLEPYRQSRLGNAWESRLQGVGTWGFRPEEIATEAHVWHGERDTISPIAMGRYWATRLPHCAATFYPGEGHSVLSVHLSDILAWLAG